MVKTKIQGSNNLRGIKEDKISDWSPGGCKGICNELFLHWLLDTCDLGYIITK